MHHVVDVVGEHEPDLQQVAGLLRAHQHHELGPLVNGRPDECVVDRMPYVIVGDPMQASAQRDNPTCHPTRRQAPAESPNGSATARTAMTSLNGSRHPERVRWFYRWHRRAVWELFPCPPHQHPDIGRSSEADVARRGQHIAAPIPGDPDDPAGWCAIVEQYLLSLELRDLSPHTVYGRRRALARLAEWVLNQNITTPTDVDEHTVHAYRLHLHRHVTTAGTPLSTRTKQQYLIAIRGLYRWLHSHGYTSHDPTAAIELPSTPLQLPRNYLTAQQAEHVLTIPDLATPLGRRDRTMLEVLYATGIRRSELAHLRLDDIDPHQHTLFVHQGKGRRDRLLPTGQRAATWINHYLTTTRRQLLRNRPDPHTLFITRNATPICTAHIGNIIATHLRAAGIPNGNCHTFRHTTATLMLHNGADLRSIQAMLGHTNLASTQRYTHINIDHLTHIHNTTHPSATSSRRDR